MCQLESTVKWSTRFVRYIRVLCLGNIQHHIIWTPTCDSAHSWRLYVWCYSTGRRNRRNQGLLFHSVTLSWYDTNQFFPYPSVIGVINMGNIVPRAVIGLTSCAFRASVLTITPPDITILLKTYLSMQRLAGEVSSTLPLHHLGSLISPSYPCLLAGYSSLAGRSGQIAALVSNAEHQASLFVCCCFTS